MQTDVIGLSLFSVKDTFKKKLLTLFQHLSQYDNHPIRKLMHEFRLFLENYIKTKHSDIKTANQFFQVEENSEFETSQFNKLRVTIIRDIKQFV